MTEVEKAKEVLRQAGFFTGNLWHVDDVKGQFQIFDDEDAQDVLNDALTNEWVMEQIHYAIDDVAEYKGFKKLEEDEN